MGELPLRMRRMSEWVDGVGTDGRSDRVSNPPPGHRPSRKVREGE